MSNESSERICPKCGHRNGVGDHGCCLALDCFCRCPTTADAQREPELSNAEIATHEQCPKSTDSLRGRSESEIRRAAAFWFCAQECYRRGEEIPAGIWLLSASDPTEADIVWAHRIIAEHPEWNEPIPVNVHRAVEPPTEADAQLSNAEIAREVATLWRSDFIGEYSESPAKWPLLAKRIEAALDAKDTRSRPTVAEDGDGWLWNQLLECVEFIRNDDAHDTALRLVAALRAPTPKPTVEAAEAIKMDRYELGDVIRLSYIKHRHDPWCIIADDVIAALTDAKNSDLDLGDEATRG